MKMKYYKETYQSLRFFYEWN